MKMLAVVPLLMLPVPASAQATRATTEDGRPVLLYPDGRWKYAPAPTRAGRGAPAVQAARLALGSGTVRDAVVAVLSSPSTLLRVRN